MERVIPLSLQSHPLQHPAAREMTISILKLSREIK